MRRIAVLLCALLLLSCVGCGKSQNDHSSLIAICVGKAQNSAQCVERPWKLMRTFL